ncbi:DASH complex subunit DAD2 [Pyrobaculum sp. 3827-6]|uniref:DASH complex subunit DAD2 n=1 Tax=Pyrobaculum sp. 3827-6 TaxID=2983604 RepID=UPI0021D84216|nr:DASH complex subunit DAD2 [Pyrobaculum sp. 3827-6]MCU7788731.1 DASH complex subunit DAD2 [Pyrobaculum sp. 3827-6]
MYIDLKTLEEVVERAVKRALEEARSEEMKAVAEALKALADYTKAGFAQLTTQVEKLEKRVSTLEDNLGSLTEATLSRYVWEDLREEVRARGEVVLARRRNARVDGLDIDLLVETDRAVYVVEVKTKPRRRDVDAVARKAEAARGAYGKPAVAILAGVRIGDDIEKYAKGKGVLVYRY